MPTTSFSEIKARVVANLLVSNVDTTSRILGWAQECQRKLEDAHNFKTMRFSYVSDSANTDGDTNAGLTLFALVINLDIATHAEVLGGVKGQLPYYIVGDTGAHVSMEWLETARQRQIFYPDPDSISGTKTHATGRPRFLQLGNLDEATHVKTATDSSQIRVFPASDSGNTIGTESALGEYKVRFQLWRRLQPITDGKTNFFSAECEYALEFFATWRGAMHNRDYDLADRFLPMWLAEKEICIRRDTREQASVGIRFRPRSGAGYRASRFSGRL